MSSNCLDREYDKADHSIQTTRISLKNAHLFHYHRIMGEIRDLVKNPTDGIRYVENDEDTVSEIHAVLDGPG